MTRTDPKLWDDRQPLSPREWIWMENADRCPEPATVRRLLTKQLGEPAPAWTDLTDLARAALEIAFGDPASWCVTSSTPGSARDLWDRCRDRHHHRYVGFHAFLKNVPSDNLPSLRRWAVDRGFDPGIRGVRRRADGRGPDRIEHVLIHNTRHTYPYAEVAGVFAHHAAELGAGRPIASPCMLDLPETIRDVLVRTHFHVLGTTGMGGKVARA